MVYLARRGGFGARGSVLFFILAAASPLVLHVVLSSLIFWILVCAGKGEKLRRKQVLRAAMSHHDES